MKTTKTKLKKILTIVITSVVISSGILYGQNTPQGQGNNGNALWQPIGQDTVFTQRVVKIGPNSLVIDGSSSLTAPANQINSTVGLISFGNAAVPYSDIKVGIGTQTPFALLPSVFGLEVNNDINLTNSVQNQGYRIGGIVVLQKPGIGNIFVGEGAGANPLNTGTDNSFLGSNAGFSNTTGEQNSFFGFNAGFSNTGGIENSFLGYRAGFPRTREVALRG